MIQAKALWLLGEIGLTYPRSVQNGISAIAAFLNSPEPLLRERAVNALGRIGRGSYHVVEQYWPDLFRFASDEEAKVRLSFIWASENIATNNPDIYEDRMPVFEELLYDTDDRVRMEAPEMFRVLGKRRPELISPYIDQLKCISETDTNRVVRIHCLGALRIAESQKKEKKTVMAEREDSITNKTKWDDRWRELNTFAMEHEIAVAPFTGADYLQEFLDFYEIRNSRDAKLVPSDGGLYKGLEDLAGEESGNAVAVETERLYGLPSGVSFFEDGKKLMEELEGPDGLAPFFFVFDIMFCEYDGFTLCFICGSNN